MKTLHIIVANKIATYSHRGGDIVCGNSDYQVEFTFSPEWDAYPQKTARFIWRGKSKDVKFSGRVCPVPIVANTEELKVGVYVEDLSTTTSAVIPCERSILCHTDVVSDGTIVIPEGTPILGEKIITENGDHYPDEGYDGFYKVSVKVAGEAAEVKLQEKTAVENGEVIADKGFDGLSKVTVNVPSGNKWRGVYEEGKPYGTDDVVRYDGNVYICIEDTDGTQNPTNAEYWQMLNKAVKYDGTINIREANTITFTIDGVEYVAKIGMDWLTWCGSKYNTEDFTCGGENSNVYDSTGTWYVTKTGGYVEGVNNIEANCAYILVNVDTGLTTMSGSYTIDQQKAYYAITALTESKAFTVEFGAGGPFGGGDEMNYHSMTFDATNDLIKYDDIEAFRCDTYMVDGDGFAGYNGAGGTGDGARINFAESTEVSKEFKELFLSIAEEYTEPETPDEPEVPEPSDSMVGQWVLKDVLDDDFVPLVNAMSGSLAFPFTSIGEDMGMITRLKINGADNLEYFKQLNAGDKVVVYDNINKQWLVEGANTIILYIEPPAEIAAKIRANATKIS